MKGPLLKVVFAVSLLGYGFYCTARFRNPYKDVEWLEDTPGAGDRYITFTPVLRSNNKEALGPAMGADYAELYFKDLDDDGIKEAIIETDGSYTLDEVHPERHVLKYQQSASGRGEFVLIKSEALPE